MINVIDIAISVLLVIFLFVISSEKMLYMPKSFDMMLIVGLLIVFLIFSIFLWKERKGDERETLHKLNAGRISFFIGSAVLIIGIAVQATNHDIDPWLIYTLTAMVTAKLASRLYSNVKH